MGYLGHVVYKLLVFRVIPVIAKCFRFLSYLILPLSLLILVVFDSILVSPHVIMALLDVIWVLQHVIVALLDSIWALLNVIWVLRADVMALLGDFYPGK